MILNTEDKKPNGGKSIERTDDNEKSSDTIFKNPANNERIEKDRSYGEGELIIVEIGKGYLTEEEKKEYCINDDDFCKGSDDE